jgi:hypothetical protein
MSFGMLLLIFCIPAQFRQWQSARVFASGDLWAGLQLLPGYSLSLPVLLPLVYQLAFMDLVHEP